MTSDDKPSWDDLRDEAAIWLARMDSGSADPKAFEAWRDADPRRAAAFVQVASALAVLDRAKPALKGEVRPVHRDRRALITGAVVVGGLTTCGLGLWGVVQAKTTIRTTVGDRKRVDLPNGATVQLNTDSKISWRAAEKRVDVWLERGEISISVASPYRRCRLHAAGRVADVSNSVLNARLRGKFVDLAVLSGDCEVLPEAASDGNSNGAGRLMVRTNQAALLASSQQIVRSLGPSDVEYIAAWPRDEMVFQGQTLETAVSEYNRYLKRKIYLADPSLAGIKLGGRFTTRDPTAFLEALRRSFGLKVVDSGEGTIVLTK